MAGALIQIYRGWLKAGRPTEIEVERELGVSKNREYPKLYYWELLRKGSAAGMWSLTDSGRDFALGRERIAKHILVFDGNLLGLDSSKTTDVREALGDKFNYEELMAA